MTSTPSEIDPNLYLARYTDTGEPLTFRDVQLRLRRFQDLLFIAEILETPEILRFHELLNTSQAASVLRYYERQSRLWRSVRDDNLVITRISYASPMEIGMYVAGGASTFTYCAAKLAVFIKTIEETRSAHYDAELKQIELERKRADHRKWLAEEVRLKSIEDLRDKSADPGNELLGYRTVGDMSRGSRRPRATSRARDPWQLIRRRYTNAADALAELESFEPIPGEKRHDTT